MFFKKFSVSEAPEKVLFFPKILKNLKTFKFKKKLANCFTFLKSNLEFYLNKFHRKPAITLFD